jgi:hypothetical protein
MRQGYWCIGVSPSCFELVDFGVNFDRRRRKESLETASPVSRRKGIQNGFVSSVRQAAAVCNVTPPVVRRWISLGLIPQLPWAVEQLQRIRGETDPEVAAAALRSPTAP